MNRIVPSKMKKVLIWCLMLALLLPLLAATVPVAVADSGCDMYVKTDNGKEMKVRSEPNKNSRSVGKVQYGQRVWWDWSYAGNDGWSRIAFGANNYGYIQTRYLVSEDPGPYVKPTTAPKTKKPTKAPVTPKPTKDPKKEAEELKKQQAELDKELKSEKEVGPFYIQVRPKRSTGWVNFRVGPSTITSKITSYPSGKELIAEGETKSWWRARDPETNKVGYIHKSLTVKLDKQVATDETAGNAQKLGKLNVNGEFELTCRIPDGYKLQVVDLRGESIIASVTSDDITKPQMYLSIAYDELYADVERMNDLSEDDLAVLEESYAAEYQVDIEYRETGHGTKLMVVKEIGEKEAFVNFLSVYKGYLVEFNLTPNPNLANKTLTEEQIQMCIDFLTDVDFNPVKQ